MSELNITLDQIVRELVYGTANRKHKILWGKTTLKSFVLETIRNSKSKSELMKKIEAM